MGRNKIYTGIVTSDKMQKTRVIKITRLAKHAKYGKIMKKHSKFKVHDEKNITKIGDLVRIEETRPLSKEKHFRLLEIVKKAALPHIELKEEIK
ncbi:MAG: 30S ribosomal protein S17 [Candidatus Omnitrophota bacterium]